MRDVFPVPRRYKGEATILKIFNKKSLLYTIIGGAIGFLFYTVLNFFGYMFTGLIICSFFLLIFYAFGSLKIPPDSFKSGGDHIDLVVLRWIKKRKRVLYVDMKNMVDIEKS